MLAELLQRAFAARKAVGLRGIENPVDDHGQRLELAGGIFAGQAPGDAAEERERRHQFEHVDRGFSPTAPTSASFSRQPESDAHHQPTGGARRGDGALGPPLPPDRLLRSPSATTRATGTYDAAAVVRLIQIRTLADAGVPLARCRNSSTPARRSSPDGIQEIDKDCAPRSGGCREPQTARPACRRRAPGAPAERRGLPRPAARPRRRRALHRAGAGRLDHVAARSRTRSTPSSPEARGARRPRHGQALSPAQPKRSTGRTTSRGSSRSPTSWSA